MILRSFLFLSLRRTTCLTCWVFGSSVLHSTSTHLPEDLRASTNWVSLELLVVDHCCRVPRCSIMNCSWVVRPRVDWNYRPMCLVVGPFYLLVEGPNLSLQMHLFAVDRHDLIAEVKCELHCRQEILRISSYCRGHNCLMHLEPEIWNFYLDFVSLYSIFMKVFNYLNNYLF